MGFRFNKRIKIAKGVNINLSKSGVGVSAGVKGLRAGVGPRGARVTASIPNTGIRKELRSKKGKAQSQPDTQYFSDPPALPSAHSRVSVLLICLILGWLGVHRFVTGKVLSGIIYLFTFGLFGVGWAYDFLRIILGGFPDRQGRKLK
jgi:hypothetical protein